MNGADSPMPRFSCLRVVMLDFMTMSSASSFILAICDDGFLRILIWSYMVFLLFRLRDPKLITSSAFSMCIGYNILHMGSVIRFCGSVFTFALVFSLFHISYSYSARYNLHFNLEVGS